MLAIYRLGYGSASENHLPFFGDGIFTQEGEPWKHSRELLRPQFHFKQYSNLQIFREASENLFNNIPPRGGVIDLQPLFFRLALDVTTEYLLGESIESLKDPESTGEYTFAEFLIPHRDM